MVMYAAYPIQPFPFRSLIRLVGLLLIVMLLLSPVAPPVQAEGPAPTKQQHYGVGETPPGLTAVEWQQITDQLEQRQYAPVTTVSPNHFLATNPAQDWRLEFTPTGLSVQPTTGDWQWGLRLQGYGRAGAMQSVDQATLSIAAQTITYQWSDHLRELYYNRSDGLKQDFIIEQRPDGVGPLRLELAALSNLTGQLANDRIDFFDAQNRLSLTYGGLHVYDATGRELSAWFSLTNSSVSPQTEIPNLGHSVVNQKSKIVNIGTVPWDVI
jgi:hypothetical protein